MKTVSGKRLAQLAEAKGWQLVRTKGKSSYFHSNWADGARGDSGARKQVSQNRSSEVLDEDHSCDRGRTLKHNKREQVISSPSLVLLPSGFDSITMLFNSDRASFQKSPVY